MRFSSPSMSFLRKIVACFLLVSMILTLSSCNGEEESSSAPAPVVTTPQVTEAPVPEPEEEDYQLQIQQPDADTLQKLTDMQSANSDTVAWLTIPDTTVDNAVVQAEDNDFYLRKDEYKQYNFYGCYYADYENTIGERNVLSRNTVIYGHNMDDNQVHGLKFGQLLKYLDDDFATNHPYIYLTTPDDQMVFKIFAAYYSDINFNYISVNPSDLEFLNILNEAEERTEYFYDVDVNATDKILTLSTCTYKYGMREDQRFVVQARLLRDGEQMPETVSITKNPSPKEPQF